MFTFAISVPPQIDRNAMIDIKVRAGQNFDLDVPVTGEPPPNKEWTLRENMVLNTDRIKVSNINSQRVLKSLALRVL